MCVCCEQSSPRRPDVFLLPFAQAAFWPLTFAQGVCAALLLPWAALSAAREALECYTYQAYYTRERRREAWELEHFPEGEVSLFLVLRIKRRAFTWTCPQRT